MKPKRRKKSLNKVPIMILNFHPVAIVIMARVLEIIRISLISLQKENNKKIRDKIY